MFTIEYYHFVTKLALERSEPNFVTKFNHVTPLLHVHARWVTPVPVSGGIIGQSLEGGLLLNIRKLFMKQALERSEQNLLQSLIMFHILLGVCSTCPCPMTYP